MARLSALWFHSRQEFIRRCRTRMRAWPFPSCMYYSVRILDRTHRLLRSEDVDCASDEEACEAASLLSAGLEWELWCGAEIVSIGKGGQRVPAQPNLGVPFTRQ